MWLVRTGIDGQYFSGDAVYVLWTGFVDVTGGTIVSYRVALTSNPATKVDDIYAWTNVGLRQNFAFRGVTLVQGHTYYAMVAAVDAVGHIGAVSVSSGQTYDATPPAVVVPDVAQVLQLIDGVPSTHYASNPAYIEVQGPRCQDPESSIASGTWVAVEVLAGGGKRERKKG